MSQQNKDKSAVADDTKGLHGQLATIRKLEDQLIDLKHKFVATSASASEDPAAEDDPTFLLLTNAGRYLAIPISYVEEVIQMPALIGLPEEKRGVLGLINYHGAMVAAIDLGEIIGTGATKLAVDNALIICQSELLKFAIVIEEATDVITVGADEIQVSTEVLPGALKALGVVPFADEVALIIDILSVALSVQLDELSGKSSASDRKNA